MNVFRLHPFHLASHLASRFNTRRFGGLFAPRKPRRRPLRVALAMLGVAVLMFLLVFGVIIGTAMLVAGALRRLWHLRGKPIAKPAAAADVIAGEYRVVRKPV